MIIRNAFSCRSYLWHSWRPSGYIHYYKSPLLFKLPRGAQQLPLNPISTSFDILAMAADNTDQMFWSREFARLVGVLTNAHLVSAAEHGEIWGHIFDWKSSLAALIHDLLQPESLLAIEHPQLHEVLSRRYYASMQARGETEVSKCTHKVDGQHRTDSYRYQQCIHDQHSTIHRQGEENVPDTYRASLCPKLLDEFVLRGILGSGSMDF